MDISIKPVLSHYPLECQPASTSTIARGGYSGATIWRLQTARGELCLRRWGREHPKIERLSFTHAVLQHVAGQCGYWIPVPISTQSGETCVQADGHLWELTPWLPGTPDLVAAPTERRMVAAMTALAQFHLAAATFSHSESATQPAAGICSRLDQLTQLHQGGFERLRSGVQEAYAIWPTLAEAGLAMLENFTKLSPRLESMLRECSRLSVPNQPCIRDIHCEHVLFMEDEVSGIIDFGAMRTDHVTGDVARLLGSVAEADSDLWIAGLAAYERIRGLSTVEHRLLKAYHASAAILSGINWLRWVFIDRREFADRRAVEQRFATIAGRLAQMADRNEPLAL